MNLKWFCKELLQFATGIDPKANINDLPFLLEKLKAPDIEVRRAAAQYLESLGPVAIEAIPILQESLIKAPDLSEYIGLARAIGAIAAESKNIEYCNTLKNALEKVSTRTVLTQDIEEVKAIARMSIVDAINAIGCTDTDTLEVLKKTLIEETHDWLKNGIIKAICNMGPAALPLLQDYAPYYRDVFEGFLKIGKPSIPILIEIVKSTEDGEEGHVLNACELLGKFKAREALPTLEMLFNKSIKKNFVGNCIGEIDPDIESRLWNSC